MLLFIKKSSILQKLFSQQTFLYLSVPSRYETWVLVSSISSKMAMHMFRRCIQNSLRFSTLYRQTTRQVSCLANRCVFSVNTLNSRVFLVEKSLIKPVASSLRCFSDAPTLSVAELEERTLEVIQKFDKVEPDKVGKLQKVLMYSTVENFNNDSTVQKCKKYQVSESWRTQGWVGSGSTPHPTFLIFDKNKRL